MKVHLIGIGGAAAAYLVDLALHNGYTVSGSDAVTGENIKRLRTKKILINVPHRPELIDDSIDEVWYSAAITPNSLGYAELEKARQLGIPHLTFAEAGARFFNRAETRVAVAGTHGKSTTTAMIGWILEYAGLDPTVALGARFRPWKASARLGSDQLFIIEADEYAKRFLELRPTHSIVTSVDPDHFDTYPTENDLLAGFRQFVELCENVLVVNGQSERVRQAVSKHRGKIIYYGFGPENDLDVWIEARGKDQFFIMPQNVLIKLLIPGKHNLMNALAAITVSARLGVSYQIGASALASFPGVERRFEYIGHLDQNQLIYDDYGHNPVEIEATISAVRDRFSHHKLILVHQPHQAGRLNRLMSETAVALVGADEVILLPVYVVAGRDEDHDIVMATSSKLANVIKAKGGSVRIAQDYDVARHQVQELLTEKCIVMTMGATDVWQVGRLLISSKGHTR